VVPLGLLRGIFDFGFSISDSESSIAEAADQSKIANLKSKIERMAMDAVMKAERGLGHEPRDVSDQKLGYDIESAIPGTGRLRFIEVKGRTRDAATVTITRNEILTALNTPDDFILAVGLVDGENIDLRYVRRPFQREPDFSATSVNYNLDELLALAQDPL
jgi:Domain of unknown function (DUF3883)